MLLNRQLNFLRNVYNKIPSLCYATVIKKKKKRSDKPFTKRFVDYQRVTVKGGKGGDGCCSFLSLFANEYAGPDGGDGGNGGHVILQADATSTSLAGLGTLLKGRDGVRGKGKHCHGKCAEHLYVNVPLGTLIKTEENELLADLANSGDMYLAARGGAGGKGNAYFLSNENRAPRTYELGAAGEEATLIAELNLIANFGLIGFPNAGKSTLLRAISRARPKVAVYPFTTLNPHVGVIKYDDHEQISVADLPGLIKGAHLNYGLGLSFLRHVERCLCLIFVLDLSHPQPWKQFDDLSYELEQYKPGLSEIPHAIIANKVDLPLAQKNLELLRKYSNLPVLPVSAKYLTNIDTLTEKLRNLFDDVKKK